MTGWWLEAACRGKPTSWWYPERGDHFAGQVARAVCAGCPVRAECLEAALDEELLVSSAPPYGIRGGKTPDQRAELLRSMRAPSVAEPVAAPVSVSTGRAAWPRRRYVAVITS